MCMFSTHAYHPPPGKSTVASLLERFYEPNLGCILLDDEDISKLDPSWLRRDVIGFIKQEPVLFASSVLENIRYGRPEATDEEVRAAAKLANADEFIRSFPEGYSTVVGERGVAVSGGQKQRWVAVVYSRTLRSRLSLGHFLYLPALLCC